MLSIRYTSVFLGSAILLLISSLSQANHLEEDITVTNPNHYYLQIAVKYLPVVFELNGIPIKTNTEDTGFQTQTILNNWLKLKNNHLRITIEEPSEAAYQLGTPSLSAILAFAGAGQKRRNIEKDTILTRIEWPNHNEETTYPKVIDYYFDQADDEHRVRINLWQDAEQVTTLSKQDKSDILGLVETMRLALMNDEPAANIFALMEYRYRDDALANGNNFLSLKAAVIEQYEFFNNFTKLHSERLTIEHAGFQLMADNHLVQVKKGESKLTIELKEIGEDGEETGRVLAIPVYVAKINGTWTIVR